MKANCWMGKKTMQVQVVPDPKILNDRDAIVKVTSLTIKSGQAHVHKYMRPLLERIERGEIDPSFVVTHRMPLDEAPRGFRIFNDKQEECMKIVLNPHSASR